MKLIPKKNLAQNFLIDKTIIDLIVDIGNITKEQELLLKEF